MTPKRPKPGSKWQHPKHPMMPAAHKIPGTLMVEEWEKFQRDTMSTPVRLVYVTSSVERMDDKSPAYQHLVVSSPRGTLAQSDVDRVLLDFDATDLVLFRLPGSPTRHYFTRGIMNEPG